MGVSQVVLVVKNPPANARDSGWIPGLAKFPGEGNGYPLQYSCLENLMDRGTWWATDHGVTRSLIDWFDLLTVQGTLKCLLQYHNLEALILWCSTFFYDPTLTSIHDYWKKIALTIWTFVIKVMSLFFNMYFNIYQVQTNTVWFHFCKVPQIVKFIESESTLVGARGWGVGGAELVFNDRILVQVGGKFRRWMMVSVV